MACALYLREPEIQAKKTWREFSQQFFDAYRDTILSYFGYLPEGVPVPLIRLNDRKLFLAVMSALAHREQFVSDRKEVAQALYDRFDLELELSSIWQYICENNSEYEDVLSFFNK